MLWHGGGEALTAQNTLGVQGVQMVAAEFVAAQIESLFSDIRSMP